PNTATSSATFNVVPQGQFNQPVNLSCGGLPANAACIFSLNPANPTPGVAVSVTVTISASTSVAAGNYTASIIGDSAGAPASKSVTLNITIPEFTVTATPLVQTIFPGPPAQTANFGG